MVANVWKVVATEGDQVEDGDTLVILESMKMEIPVLAEEAGTLAKLHVVERDGGEGAVVQAGAVSVRSSWVARAGVGPVDGGVGGRVTRWAVWWSRGG